MTQVAAMAIAITELQKQLGATAPTTDQIAGQIHTIVDPQVQALNDAFTAFKAKETTDEADIADLEAAFTEFTTAFTPASPPASAPDSPPVTGASS